MECAILNYGVGSVDLVTVPDDINNVEVYLCDVLGYREDEIEFMIKEGKINVKDDIEVGRTSGVLTADILENKIKEFYA